LFREATTSTEVETENGLARECCGFFFLINVVQSRISKQVLVAASYMLPSMMNIEW
jgi:hypothetical protein